MEEERLCRTVGRAGPGCHRGLWRLLQFLFLLLLMPCQCQVVVFAGAELTAWSAANARPRRRRQAGRLTSSMKSIKYYGEAFPPFYRQLF